MSGLNDMKKQITYIIICIASLIMASCTNENTGSAYPKDASSVTSNKEFILAFESKETGNSYYLRRLAENEVEQMPEDYIIEGEYVSILFVPIKNGEIVEAPLADRIALGYNIPDNLLEE